MTWGALKIVVADQGMSHFHLKLLPWHDLSFASTFEACAEQMLFGICTLLTLAVLFSIVTL